MAIANAVSFVAFAKANGSTFKIGHFCNGDTGECFDKLVFGAEKPYTFVAFAKSLGSLSPQQLKEQKDALQVVTNDDGKLYLCKAGSSFEEVNLFD